MAGTTHAFRQVGRQRMHCLDRVFRRCCLLDAVDQRRPHDHTIGGTGHISRLLGGLDTKPYRYRQTGMQLKTCHRALYRFARGRASTSHTRH